MRSPSPLAAQTTPAGQFSCRSHAWELDCRALGHRCGCNTPSRPHIAGHRMHIVPTSTEVCPDAEALQCQVLRRRRARDHQNRLPRGTESRPNQRIQRQLWPEHPSGPPSGLRAVGPPNIRCWRLCSGSKCSADAILHHSRYRLGMRYSIYFSRSRAGVRVAGGMRCRGPSRRVSACWTSGRL